MGLPLASLISLAPWADKYSKVSSGFTFLKPLPATPFISSKKVLTVFPEI